MIWSMRLLFSEAVAGITKEATTAATSIARTLMRPPASGLDTATMIRVEERSDELR